MRRVAFSGTALAVLAVLVGACGGAGAATGTRDSSGVTSVPSNTVTVGTASFAPAAITVPVNTTVTWDWNSCSNDPYAGQTCVSHGVVFDDTTIAGSAVQSSGSFSKAFAAKGVYTYHCAVHGTAMSGTITVE